MATKRKKPAIEPSKDEARNRRKPINEELIRFGQAIKFLRLEGWDDEEKEKRQWPLRTLAQKAGTSPVHISRIEIGAAEPGLFLARSIAIALHVSLDDLLLVAAGKKEASALLSKAPDSPAKLNR